MYLFYIVICCLIAGSNGDPVWEDFCTYDENKQTAYCYYWPMTVYPFNDIRGYLTSPFCQNYNCEIRVVPCNISCDPDIALNCRPANDIAYLNLCSTETDSVYTSIFSPILIATPGLTIRGPSSSFPAFFFIVSPGGGYYSQIASGSCSAFTINAEDVSFRFITFLIDNRCTSANLPKNDITAYVPLLYNKGGNVILENVNYTNSTLPLAVFSNNTAMHLDLNIKNIIRDMSYSDDELGLALKQPSVPRDVLLLNVEGTLQTFGKIDMFMFGKLRYTGTSFNASEFIDLAAWTDYGCSAPERSSNSYCESKKSTNNLLEYILISLISVGAIIGIHFIWENKNKNHLKTTTEE